jgi:hypothetical protein
MTLRQVQKLTKIEWLVLVYKLGRGVRLEQIKLKDLRREAEWA